MRQIFEKYYQQNFWSDPSSVSGAGSNLEATEVIREAIPRVVAQFGITSILDIPCGDLFWMSHVKGIENISYIGADIVPQLIMDNMKLHYRTDMRVLDAMNDNLPKVDLILCRDMLGHFSNADVQKTLKNFRASGATYLLTTTFPGRQTTQDIQTGEWRPIDLDYMWGMPAPLLMINEGCTIAGGEFSDKSLGLYKLDDMN